MVYKSITDQFSHKFNMVEETQMEFNLEDILKGVNPEQAIKLRSEFHKMNILNQTKAARQASYSHIKTLADLENYERNRIDQI